MKRIKKIKIVVLKIARFQKVHLCEKKIYWCEDLLPDREQTEKYKVKYLNFNG